MPIHFWKVTLTLTLSAMRAEDEKRMVRGDPLINEDELMKLAKAKEGFLLEFEAEM